jgi:vacuolar-type H+-ATPase subunit I/STV1
MKKKNRKDGNDPLFDMAFGISLGDDAYENHEVEKRIQKYIEQIKKKDEIIKKLKGEESHDVLEKQIGKLQDDNKKLQDIIDKSKVSERIILDKINTLKKESDILSQIIDKLSDIIDNKLTRMK